MVMAKKVGYQELASPLFSLPLGYIGQFLHPRLDSGDPDAGR